MFRIVVTLLLMLTAPSMSAAEESPQPQAIIKKMKTVLEPDQSSIRQVTIAMEASGETVQWTAHQAFKTLPDGKWMLSVISQPESLRGNAFLVHEPQREPSVIWMYLPALRRVRELVPVDIYQRFLGTDFTYADLGFVRLHEMYKLLDEEELNGVQAYKIGEEIPQERVYYSQVVIWVATGSMLPLQRDYYDIAGRLWKTERFEEVTAIEGVPTPRQITMHDVQRQTSTRLTIDQVRYNVTVPDALFDPAQLPQAATSSVWQAVAAVATQER